MSEYINTKTDAAQVRAFQDAMARALELFTESCWTHRHENLELSGRLELDARAMCGEFHMHPDLIQAMREEAVYRCTLREFGERAVDE